MRPMARPYPRGACLAAADWLVNQGHARLTAKCAEGTNSPMWQRAVHQHMSDDQIAQCEQQGAELIAKYARP